MPMGPLRLIDEIGVDITVDIADTLEKAFGARDRAPEILRKMYDAKMLGRKSGGGFYKYEGKQQTPSEALQEWRQESGENFAAENITDRLTFLMVNEAARCLEEKVVATPEDADYGMILGTGFPTFRGGPLRYAESYGLKKLVTEMDGLHSRAGENLRRAICFVSTPRMELHSMETTGRARLRRAADVSHGSAERRPTSI